MNFEKYVYLIFKGEILNSPFLLQKMWYNKHVFTHFYKDIIFIVRKNMFELLSPAGSMDSLKAGIQNGADAIYLGGNSFGARASATNFDNDELKEAVKYAKLRNVNIFVTVNTSIKETEVEEEVSENSEMKNIEEEIEEINEILKVSKNKKTKHKK